MFSMLAAPVYNRKKKKKVQHASLIYLGQINWLEEGDPNQVLLKDLGTVSFPSTALVLSYDHSVAAALY